MSGPEAPKDKSQLIVDLDAIHSAIVNSKQAKEFLQQLVDELQSRAESDARSRASEEGWYARSFSNAVVSAKALRRVANKLNKHGQGEKGPGSNRRRRGQRNKHKYLDTYIITNGTYNLKNRMVDPDFKAYEGLVGIVANDDWKAVWIEYGTLAMPGRYILQNAAESIAMKYQAEFEIMYGSTSNVNRAELGRRISYGLKKRAAARAELKARSEGNS